MVRQIQKIAVAGENTYVFVDVTSNPHLAPSQERLQELVNQRRAFLGTSPSHHRMGIYLPQAEMHQ